MAVSCRSAADVLERPAFAFPPGLVADLLALLARADWVLPDPLPIEIRDPDALAFLAKTLIGNNLKCCLRRGQ
jgi:hypothetical protein